MYNYNSKSKRTVYFIILLTMMIMMAIFLNSFYWPYEEVSKRKLLVWIIAGFGVIVFPLLCVKINFLYQYVQNIICRVETLMQKIKQNSKVILLLLLGIAFSIGIAYVAAEVMCQYVMHSPYNSKLFELFVGLFSITVLICFLGRNAHKQQAIIFLIISLIMGGTSLSVMPNRVGISWDDEIHYKRTLEISNLLNGIMYVADERNIIEYADNIYGRQGYDRESATQYEQELETSYEFKEWNSHKFREYGIWSLSYIPAAIGIMLARGLGFSYIGVFNMGRMFNLLAYALLIYFAIKRLKYGKVLIATIGLIPTSLFMAASYSYDWWVTGFTILGFSYFFAELQDEETLKIKNVLIIIGSVLLGCLPKAIYFPILFPLLFMPKKKFKNVKQRQMFYFLVIGAGVLLVASFMLPMLFNGTGTGDARGGAEVNATEQIRYILQNPVEFIKMLFNFLKYYVSPQSTGPMLQRLAYMGEGEFYGIVSVILVVVAFLDRGDMCEVHPVVRIAGITGCAVALVLSTTALYVSFTAVGADTVAGMQGRYMIPFIFPTLYCMGVGGVQHKINKNAFVCVPMIIISLTFFYNMWRSCVLPY